MKALYRFTFCLVVCFLLECGDSGSVNVLAQATAVDNAERNTLYVLAIGINSYRYHNSQDPLFKRNPLWAAKDAEDFSSALDSVARGNFAQLSIHLLQNQQATRSGIEDAVREISTKAKPQDTFVFFYSGHGLSFPIDPGGLEQFCLIPSDYNPLGGSDEIKTKGISSGLLETWFLNILARHQMIVLDSSKSSAGFEEFASGLRQDYTVLRPFVERDTVVISLKDTSFEFNTIGNGLLTYVLLEGINGGAANTGSGISAKGLAEYTDGTFPLILSRIVAESHRGAKNAARVIAEHPEAGKPVTYISGKDFPIGTKPGFSGSVNEGQKLLKNRELRADPNNAESFHRISSDTKQMVALEKREDSDLFIVGEPPSLDSPAPGPQADESFVPKVRCRPMSEITAANSTSARTGRDVALLIGIDDYDHWNHLLNPVFDAQTIADTLRTQFGFDTELVRNPDVDCVGDAFLKYKNRVRMPDDAQLLIFFAGHGVYHPLEREGYLIARDSDAKTADTFGRSYIRQSVIRNIVESIPFKHIFVIIDACQGGAFEGPLQTRNAQTDAASAVATASVQMDDQPLADQEIVDVLMKFKTRRFLTSGALEYVPDGVPGHHSPFASRLLSAFNTPVQHKFISIEDIMQVMKFMQPVPVLGEISTNDHQSDFLFFLQETLPTGGAITATQPAWVVHTFASSEDPEPRER
jgi:uncharacterized caspase-like protein